MLVATTSTGAIVGLFKKEPSDAQMDRAYADHLGTTCSEGMSRGMVDFEEHEPVSDSLPRSALSDLATITRRVTYTERNMAFYRALLKRSTKLMDHDSKKPKSIDLDEWTRIVNVKHIQSISPAPGPVDPALAPRRVGEGDAVSDPTVTIDVTLVVYVPTDHYRQAP